MDRSAVRDRIEHHLEVLVERIGARPPGSEANRRATDHVTAVLAAAGLEVRTFPFDTRWWEPGAGRLTWADGHLDVAPNPYSPTCDLDAVMVRATTLAELETLAATPTEAAGRILVLAGDLAREPIFPPCFPFVSLDEHRRVVEALHVAQPAAIVAVSENWQPILEDPDLHIPSTTVRPDVGDRLRAGTGARLQLGGAVHHGSGATVSGLTGGGGRRIVVSAHLDSKSTTPGAFDNAGGVAVLLAMAEQGLPDLPIELVLFNGEDHADACGEVAWLAGTRLDEVVANINIDGAGLVDLDSTIASLSCPPDLDDWLDRFVAQRPGWSRTAPWMESDHAIFAMQGIPALAITTEDVHALLGELAHGPADTIEVVDPATLADVALTVEQLIPGVDAILAPPRR